MATTIKKDIYMTSLGEVAYFTICDDECGSVVLSALGAGVVALSVPDGNGEYRDVVIGYPSAEAYCHDDPNAGKFIGRYANRIARGVFSIEAMSTILNATAVRTPCTADVKALPTEYGRAARWATMPWSFRSRAMTATRAILER